MAALAASGASIAVFRATLPDVESLRVGTDISLVDATGPAFARLLEAYTGARIESGNRGETSCGGAASR